MKPSTAVNHKEEDYPEEIAAGQTAEPVRLRGIDQGALTAIFLDTKKKCVEPKKGTTETRKDQTMVTEPRRHNQREP